jgi:hypothetical protein
MTSSPFQFPVSQLKPHGEIEKQIEEQTSDRREAYPVLILC